VDTPGVVAGRAETVQMVQRRTDRRTLTPDLAQDLPYSRHDKTHASDCGGCMSAGCTAGPVVLTQDKRGLVA